MYQRFLAIVAVAGLGIGLAACSEDKVEVAKAPQIYDAETFYMTTTYTIPFVSGGLVFSPDGAEVLISSDASGIFNAYSVPVGGGAPLALTESTTDSIFALSWFPSDRRILYAADEGGNELDHIFVRAEDGALRDLTPGDKLKANFVGWLADGSGFWLTTNERDPKFFDLYRYDVADYSRQLAFQNDAGFSIADVSGDGRWLALVKSRTSADSDVYVADLSAAAAEPVLISEHQGNIAYDVYRFTPDSTSLVYATDEHGEYFEAWTYALESGQKAALASAEWDVSDVGFSPAGRYRVVSVNEDASTRVTITDQTNGEVVALPELPRGNLTRLRFDASESKLAFRLNADTSPTNIHVVDLVANTQVQLTNALNPAIDQADLVPATVERYESYDGLKIPGILFKPKTASAENPVPALVWVHGGPGGQSRVGYSPRIQHLVNHGYAVFAANNRGSSGYGKTFFHLDDRKHGEVDLDDIVEAKTYLQSLEWVDGEKIGIIGGSYGGYMVGAALAFRSGTFEVGVNIFGVMNWVRTLNSIPPWWESFREALFDEMGDPATDAERHRRISPLFHASNIVTPMLVVQGANDPRVLQIESDEIVEAVRANGVPVEYLIFPDEGHGFTKRENRIAASEAYLSFLDQYLKGIAVPAAQAAE